MGYPDAAAFRDSLKGPGEMRPEGTYVPLHLRPAQPTASNISVKKMTPTEIPTKKQG